MQRERDPGPDRPDSHRSRRRDAGFSLVEIVISITLMGTVVVAIIGAVRTLVVASSVGREAAQVETVIVNAADRVNRAPKRCDYTVFVQAAVQSQGWQADSASVSHDRYVPAASPIGQGQWVPGACEIDSPTDLLVQRVTITITSPDGKVRRNIQVVKSDV